MSMTCQLLAVTAEEAARLRKRPIGIEALLDEPATTAENPLASVIALMNQLPEAERAQAQAQLDAIRALQGLVGMKKKRRGSGAKAADRLDLDKAWHGVHWLLCGAAEPDGSAAGNAVMGGAELGEDLGYGPARMLAAEEVAAVATALTALGETALRGRYDGAAMDRAGIYPGNFANDADWPGQIVAQALELREFYARAGAAGNVVVIAMT